MVSIVPCRVIDGVDHPDADRAEQAWRVLEHAQPGVGHVQHPGHDQRSQRRQPGVGHHRLDRCPVAAEDDGIEVGRRGQQDPDGDGRRVLQGDPHLPLATAGEPLLRLPARRAAPVHESRARPSRTSAPTR